MKVDVLGVPFDALTFDEAVKRSVELLSAQGVHRVVTPNPEIVWKCVNDKEFMEVIRSSDLVFADGIGIVRAAEKLGRPLPGRVMGVEWAAAMFPEIEKLGKRLYLFGGKPGVAELAAKNIAAKFPKLNICGARDGYFSDSRAVALEIAEAKPDVIIVCLGMGKQEFWMRDHSVLFENVLMAGLGGSIDVFAGIVPRAPAITSKLGLEWLYRIIKQPSRLPRMAAIPKFLRAVNKQKKQEKKK